MDAFKRMKDKLDKCFFPAVPVTFDKKGGIVDEAQAKYAQYMDKQPVSGVALWVHTGRGLMLSKEQREKVFNTWRKALSGDKDIICGVGSKLAGEMTEEEYIGNTLEMGEQAKALGADAILLYPPAFYRGKPEQDEKVLEYHKKVCEIGLPVIVFYLYEEAGGILYSREVLEKIFAIENIAGIKMATLDSAMTYQDVSNMILRCFPEIKLITGEDRMYGYTLARGACGSLVGLGAVCQKLQREMMDAFWTEDYELFVKRMLQVDKLAECTFIRPMEGYIEKMLYILNLQGIIPEEAVNDPYGPGITEEEKAEIKRVLKEIGEI